MIFSDKELRLFSIIEPPVFIAIHKSRVNIKDLINVWNTPGTIVRCDGNPSELIKIFDAYRDSTGYGCVAGWISEDD